MKIRTIITGSTGMVGEGVLHICLNSPEVESVLVIKFRKKNEQSGWLNYKKATTDYSKLF